MCDTCLTIEHADGDYIFAQVFGHHPACPNFDAAKIDRRQMLDQFDTQVRMAAERIYYDRWHRKFAAEQAHETRQRNNRKPPRDRPIREHDVQAVLYQNLRWDKKHKWIAPNVDVFSTGECDMFSVTVAGLAVEHEIKLSRSDFFADKKKEHKHPQLELVAQGIMSVAEPPYSWRPGPRIRTITAPNYYYYVVPRDLVKPEEVPAYAGLIYFDSDKFWDRSLAFERVKTAKLLHKNKIDTALLLKVGDKLMYRCWSAREKLTRQHLIETETI
jgi:hypothetical protein